MQTVTIKLTVPDELANRIHALPPGVFNRLFADALPSILEAVEKEATRVKARRLEPILQPDIDAANR